MEIEKALYIVNKYVKTVRDCREAIIHELFSHGEKFESIELSKEVFEKYGVDFENLRQIEGAYKEPYSNIEELKDEIREMENDEEWEDDIEEYEKILEYSERNRQKAHEVLREMKDEICELYKLKDTVLNKIEDKKLIGYHKSERLFEETGNGFEDEEVEGGIFSCYEYFALYQVGEYTFHLPTDVEVKADEELGEIKEPIQAKMFPMNDVKIAIKTCKDFLTM